MADESAAGYLDARIDALREHLASLAAAVPQLPAAFGGVQDQLMLEWQARGRGYVLGLIAAFCFSGSRWKLPTATVFRKQKPSGCAPWRCASRAPSAG